jgi:tetratricopeptide (TPR) repeat protein
MANEQRGARESRSDGASRLEPLESWLEGSPPAATLNSRELFGRSLPPTDRSERDRIDLSGILSSIPARSVSGYELRDVDELSRGESDGRSLLGAGVPSTGEERIWSPLNDESGLPGLEPDANGPDEWPRAKGAAGDFILRRKLGEGGMGIVWQATQTSLSREVAIKQVKGDGDLLDFLQEAYTSAELDHPNIVPVHELAQLNMPGGDGRDAPAIAMKMVRGVAWGERIRDDRRDPAFEREDFLARHLRVLVEVCHAVAYAHAKKIVHRDLKPYQVMLGEFGEVFLADWGLAISMLDEPPVVAGRGIPKHRSRSTGGNPSGTPAYMAPEQTSSSTDRLGPATDVYLLGAILYDLLAGKPPHHASSGRAAFRLAEANAWDPLPVEAPEELARLVERALATDPAGRPASAAAFREEIEDYLSGAGKRRESKDLAASARRTLAGAEGDYANFADALATLGRARALWGANPELDPLFADGLAGYAAAALGHGDLTLARAQAKQIPKSDGRREATLRRVDAAETLARRRDRQRRVAVACALLFAAGAVATLLFGLDARSRQKIAARDAQLNLERGNRLEKEKELERERALRLDSERQEQERIANLFQRINELRRDENAVAFEMEREFPTPRRLAAADGASDEFATAAEETPDPAISGALLSRRADLAERRREVSTMAGEGVLEPEPPTLTLAAANVEMAAATEPRGALLAYDLYAQAATKLPSHPDPLVGMAVAAANADQPSSAVALLEKASGLAASLYGERDRRSADILGMAGDAAARMGDDEAAFRLNNASSDALEERWLELTTALANRAYHASDYERAEKYAGMALKGAKSLLPVHSPEVVGVELLVGAALLQLGRTEESEALLKAAIDSLPSNLPESLAARARLLRALGRAYVGESRLPEAAETFEQALALVDEATVDARTIGMIKVQLGEAKIMLGSFQEGLDLTTEGEAILSREQGKNHPNAIVARTSRARALRYLGRLDEAEALLREQVAIVEEMLDDPDHALRGVALQNLAMFLNEVGNAREALEPAREAARIFRAKHGSDGPKLAAVLLTLANACSGADLGAEAEAAARESLAICDSWDDPSHQLRLSALNTLAVMLDNGTTDGRQEAIPLFEESIRLEREKGERPDIVANGLSNLAATLAREDRAAEAEAMVREALAIQAEFAGEGDPSVAEMMNSLAFNLMSQGKNAEAEGHLLAALAIQREKLGARMPTALTALNLVGVYSELKQWDKIPPVVAEMRPILEAAVGPMHPYSVNGVVMLATALENLGRTDEELEARRIIVERWEAIFGERSWQAAQERDKIATRLLEAERWKECAAQSAENYELGDPEGKAPALRLERVSLSLARAGETAEARAPLLFAIASVRRQPESTQESEALLRRLLGSLLETIAATAAGPSDARLALQLGAWLDEAEFAAGAVDLGAIRGRIGTGMAPRLARLAEMALALDPPNLEAARRLALRAAALPVAAGRAPGEGIPEERFAALLQRLELAEAAAAIPAPPDDFWPDRDANPIDAEKLRAWLDAVAPPPDWTESGLNAAEWTHNALEPSGEELEAALERALRLALGMAPGDGSAAGGSAQEDDSSED